VEKSFVIQPEAATNDNHGVAKSDSILDLDTLLDRDAFLPGLQNFTKDLPLVSTQAVADAKVYVSRFVETMKRGSR